MQVKVLEIRDVGTYFALLCVDMQPDNDAQRYHTHAAEDGLVMWADKIEEPTDA